MRARVDIVGRRRRIQDGDQAEAIDRGYRRHFIEIHCPKFPVKQCLDQLRMANTLVFSGSGYRLWRVARLSRSVPFIVLRIWVIFCNITSFDLNKSTRIWAHEMHVIRTSPEPNGSQEVLYAFNFAGIALLVNG
jgi:hypothetical protein